MKCKPILNAIYLLNVYSEPTFNLLCPLQLHQMQTCLVAFPLAFYKHETILSLPALNQNQD